MRHCARRNSRCSKQQGSSRSYHVICGGIAILTCHVILAHRTDYMHTEILELVNEQPMLNGNYSYDALLCPGLMRSRRIRGYLRSFAPHLRCFRAVHIHVFARPGATVPGGKKAKRTWPDGISSRSGPRLVNAAGPVATHSRGELMRRDMAFYPYSTMWLPHGLLSGVAASCLWCGCLSRG
jgi:hypothetical protein